MSFDNSSFLERRQNFRTNIGAAANRRRIAQRCRSLIHRQGDLSFWPELHFPVLRGNARQGAGANQGAGPGAKVFGAKSVTHDFFDVAVDVAPFDIDEVAGGFLILKHFARRMLESLSDDACRPAVAQSPTSTHTSFAGK